ncbi:MAG: PQQ-binding-like beta-propeller repeat protein [Verrucomicrobiota bacterium]
MQLAYPQTTLQNTLLATTLGIILSASSAPAENWPFFHGPNRISTSNETGLNIDWDSNGPKVLWSTPVGEGFGGAAIVDDEVFLIDRELGETDFLRCLDRATGEEKWRFSQTVEGRLPHPGSRGVPTVEEDAVYMIGGFGQVHRINRETHEADWTVDIQEQYDTLTPKWGYAQSPLVVDDVVVIAPMSETVGLAGLDKNTGEEKWRTEPFGDSHSSPVLLDLQGVPQVLFLAVKRDPDGDDGVGTTISVDPASGNVLWQTNEYFNKIPITPPFQIDQSRLFLTGGYECGSAMLELAKSGDDWSVKKLFDLEKGSQIHPPILFEDHLYFLANENANYNGELRESGGLLCMDLNGNELWRTGNDPFMGRGNILFADGHLFIQDGHIGYLRVVKPSTEGFRLVAEADIFDKVSEVQAAREGSSGSTRKTREPDYKMWSPMALSNGQLFMRSNDELKCIDLGAK